MRVISGKYKRKQLQGFDLKNTRPTMDRVKESLFAMIQTDIPNSVCLDLFAGSGALGIEALSMGAKECCFVDNSKEAIKVIEKNLTNVTEKTTVLNMDYRTALKRFKENNQQFDIIFLDPPYEKEDLEQIIKLIDNYDLIKDGGLIVVETTVDINNLYKCIKVKKINNKLIKVYRK